MGGQAHITTGTELRSSTSQRQGSARASLHLSGFCASLMVKMFSTQCRDALCSGLAHFPWSHAVTLQTSVKYSILRRLLSPRTTKVKLPLSLEISSGA